MDARNEVDAHVFRKPEDNSVVIDLPSVPLCGSREAAHQQSSGINGRCDAPGGCSEDAMSEKAAEKSFVLHGTPVSARIGSSGDPVLNRPGNPATDAKIGLKYRFGCTAWASTIGTKSRARVFMIKKLT
jgi:hypothetical protein